MWSLLLILLNIYTGIAPEPKPVSTNFKINPPLRTVMYLSGNFGELRNNHFHSGLDIKAQPGTPVYCVEDGFVSRVSVSPYGYGYAVYVDHPSIGVTTVYGHLSRFAPFIDKEVKQRQYALESFSVNLLFKKDEIKVRKGQVISYSGNSGSSGGPHLHFEIRETESEYLIDPMPFLKEKLKDTRSPQIRSIAVFSTENGWKKEERSVIRQKNGTMGISSPLTAWGKIALGVKAYDYMNETNNIYGVYSIRLFVDDKLVYSSAVDRYPFDKSRAVNSFIDYGAWLKNKSFIMRSYVASGNYLPIYSNVVDQGLVTIDQERDYRIQYELRDHYGNLTICTFPIKGVRRQNPATTDSSGNSGFSYDKDYRIVRNGLSLNIPKGALYENARFECQYLKDDDRFVIGSDDIPLHTYCTLKVRIPKDTLRNKKQYYLVRIAGKREIPYICEYKRGHLETRIRDFGIFSVKSDLLSPVITPISPAQWGRSGRIRIKIGDRHTGVDSFKGEIDGKFVLFEMDGKTGILDFRLDPAYVVKNRDHLLKLTVTDGCGNEAVYENTFYW